MKGYVGSESTLLALKETITDLKSTKKQSLLYVMDPVMGDNDYLYVPKELIPIYISMLKMADIITPNMYELQLLTDIQIKTLEDAKKALKEVHRLSVKFAVMTSMPWVDETLLLVGSVVENGVVLQFSVQFPKIKQNFTGTGDTFTALLIGYLAGKEMDYVNFREACVKAVNVVHLMIDTTFKSILRAGYTEESFELLPKNIKMRMRELDALSCRGDIENPVILYSETDLL